VNSLPNAIIASPMKPIMSPVDLPLAIAAIPTRWSQVSLRRYGARRPLGYRAGKIEQAADPFRQSGAIDFHAARFRDLLDRDQEGQQRGVQVPSSPVANCSFAALPGAGSWLSISRAGQRSLQRHGPARCRVTTPSGWSAVSRQALPTAFLAALRATSAAAQSAQNSGSRR